jgi:hypothetical protein
MHLHTVHTSSYYSGVGTTTATTKTTSAGPCLNVSMASRVVHGIQKCISAASTSNSSSSFNASTAFPTHFTTIYSRSTDSTDSKDGLSTAGIYAIAVVAVIVGLALWIAASCLSHRPMKHHAKSAKGPTIPMQDYRSGAGISAPPRSHGGRAKAPQFPGPRNGFAPGGHSRR